MRSLTTLAFVVLIAHLYSCGPKSNLSGHIEGLDNDTLLIMYSSVHNLSTADEPLLDTIYTKNGIFNYDSPIEDPVMIYLFPKKGEFVRSDGSPYRPRHMYAEFLLGPKDQIYLDGSLKEYYLKYTISGSAFNKDFSQLRDEYIEETSVAAKIEMQIDSLYSLNADQKDIEALFEERNKTNRIASTKKLEYVKNNLDKELSAYFLLSQKLDTLNHYYAQLDDQVKTGIFKSFLDALLIQSKKYNMVREAQERIIEGANAPAFTLTSDQGNDLSLKSVQGKYLILDFWGSWCGWCIKGFPKMKEYYEKYNDRLEILGIACNDNEAAWKKSIADNELPWPQVINNEELNQDVSVKYGIQAYPTKFILDPEGRILSKFEGEGDGFYQKLEEIMSAP